MKQNKQPEGHYMGLGIAIGVAIGAGIGAALGNAAFGISIGVAIGVAIGAGYEQEAVKKGKIRPLTKQERARQKKFIWIALLIAFLVFITILGSFMFLKT